METGVDQCRYTADTFPGRATWLKATLEVQEGRDPLGLQTTTQDRLNPLLLPGILELTRRARYLSFHSFLLDEYRRRHGRPDRDSLSVFIKAREWEYGLAVLNLPHQCGSTPVGANALRSMMGRQLPPYPRGESVKSLYGGARPLLSHPAGRVRDRGESWNPSRDTPIPIDVLYDTERAGALALTFRAAVAETAYIREWMYGTDPIPLDVLVEYAGVGCLCQLSSHPAERDAVSDAMFGEPFDDPSAISGGSGATSDSALPTGPMAAEQRRRSIAHFLTLVAAHPDIVDNEEVYREALWTPPPPRSATQTEIAGQWAGLIAKDVWQEALCSLWTEFTQTGVQQTHAAGRGLTWAEVRRLAEGMTGGAPTSTLPGRPPRSLPTSPQGT